MSGKHFEMCECPKCYALIEPDGLQKYEMVKCWNCGADLEFVGDCMVDANEAEKQWWVIFISGYGAYLVYETEEEAEEKRKAKAIWEGGIGRKRLADQEEIRSGKAKHCWNHPGFNNKSKYADCGCKFCRKAEI